MTLKTNPVWCAFASFLEALCAIAALGATVTGLYLGEWKHDYLRATYVLMWAVLVYCVSASRKP